jgi:hypothetical protein
MKSSILSNKQGRLVVFLGLPVAAIAAYIPFHAFFSVLLGATTGYPLMFKSWKEILLVAMTVAAAVLLYRNQKIATMFLRSRINQLAMAFVALHAVLALFLHNGLAATFAGLAIDTRFFIFFLLVRVAVLFLPDLPRLLFKIFLITGAIVVGFGFLQQYLLPADFLKHFGYSLDTIAPYLTVDSNPEYIRINSTLRGPNPLGAFVMMYIVALSIYMTYAWRGLSTNRKVLGFLGLFASGSVLYASHSRSAMLATAIALSVAAIVMVPVRYKKLALIGMAVAAVLAGGVYYLVKDTKFVQIVVEHEDPDGTVPLKSNEGHMQSLIDGSARVADEPFGAGIGSTGSASLYSENPLIIENQYLFVAHEAGWLGLVLFVSVQGGILYLLYRKASDWRAVALLASGVGLIVIGLLLPVFTDDTIAYLWWGLAGTIAGNLWKRI